MRLFFCLLTIFSFFFSSCVLSSIVLTKKELDAERLMKEASVYETEEEHQKAGQVYQDVIENYSGTVFYEEALFKSALMNIHPDNPNPDYNMAYEQLQDYLKLDPDDEQTLLARGYIAILTLIRETDSEKKELAAEITRLKKEAQTEQRKLITELANYELKIKDLEEKLQKLKDIDVQMHEKRRKQRKEM